MARYVTVGAAQFGPVQRRETRDEVVDRLLDLLEQGPPLVEKEGERRRKEPFARVHVCPVVPPDIALLEMLARRVATPTRRHGTLGNVLDRAQPVAWAP